MDLTYPGAAGDVPPCGRSPAPSPTRTGRSSSTYAERYIAAKGPAAALVGTGSSTSRSRRGPAWLKRVHRGANRVAPGRIPPPHRVYVPAQRRLRGSTTFTPLGTAPRPSRGMTAAPRPAPTSASCVAYRGGVRHAAARGRAGAACASASRDKSSLRAR